MNSTLPPFAVTQVGSWPRSDDMLDALRARRLGRMDRDAFEAVVDRETERCVAAQERAGVDVVVSGELGRDSFYSFITDKVDGTRLMSLADMLDTVENKAAFEEMLETLDVPASAIRNPTCTGKIARREPLAVDELKRVRRFTGKPVKITLPGPYLLTRAMWVTDFSQGDDYADKPEMAGDVVKILREELEDLREAGADFVQFDEPVLTEIVHSGETKRRTFM
jgi:5-methyltetrahydropteroyltriglutamate--homocysteine methyltransferase